MTRRVVVPILTLAVALAALPWLWRAWGQEAMPKRKVMKTDEYWAKVLTPEQFMVTRRKATEAAFSGKYASSHAKGTYACVCCGAELFGSQAKFDSGTGWPSFWRPLDPKRVETAPDYHMAEPRVEVMCRDCGAHLGHVFNDGPPPTGLRFCINSASLKLLPAKSGTASGSTSSKKAARPSGKSKAKGKSRTRPGGNAEPSPSTDPADEPQPAPPESKPAEGKDKDAA